MVKKKPYKWAYKIGSDSHIFTYTLYRAGVNLGTTRGWYTREAAEQAAQERIEKLRGIFRRQAIDAGREPRD